MGLSFSHGNALIQTPKQQKGGRKCAQAAARFKVKNESEAFEAQIVVDR